MNRVEHVRHMATYNQWMNRNLYTAAAQLPPAELTADKHTFFGSIIGTFNHLVIGDLIWLRRFANHPRQYPQLQNIAHFPHTNQLNQTIYNDLPSLLTLRSNLDELILDWTGSIEEADLDVSVSYFNLQGIETKKNFFALLMHFFNHQTHHRGQITTLLSQSGIDYGDTDLNLLVPNELDD